MKRFPSDSIRGIALLQVVMALTLLTLGAGAIAMMGMAHSNQHQSLAAQSSRSTYTTFQQEILVEGLDPNRIINPVAGVVQQGTPNDDGVSPRSLVAEFGTGRSAAQGPGSGVRGQVVATGGADGSGERGGALGFETGTSADAPDFGVQTLNAPSFTVGFTLSFDDFNGNGAADWVQFPANNPFGTVYRYTVDGSEPTTDSPIWSQSVAMAFSPESFPGHLRIRATHPDPRYQPSATITRSPLRLQMPAVSITREFPKAQNLNFTYEEVRDGHNRILLVPSIPSGLAQLYFTLDGSDPVVSGVPYHGPFLPGLTEWGTQSPPRIILRVANRGPAGDERYLPYTTTFTLQGIPTVLAAPEVSQPNGAAIPAGTTLFFTHALPEATFRFEKGPAPVTPQSPQANSTTLP